MEIINSYIHTVGNNDANFELVSTDAQYIHTYMHTNLYSAKIVERIWGAGAQIWLQKWDYLIDSRMLW